MSRLMVLHGCCTLQLTQGQNTLIDAVDYPVLSRRKWQVTECRERLYAVGREHLLPNGVNPKRNFYLHRWLLSDELQKLPPKTEVDHKNRDTLDNSRNNLRTAMKGQNRQNSRKRITQGAKGAPSSQYKGVGWYKRFCKWRAYIVNRGKQTELGMFDTEIEAARAYNRAALHLFGEFARVNEFI